MIDIYSPGNTDYEKNGDMTLMPSAAEVHAVLNGTWEAELEHPIDPEGRWKYVVEDAVVRMPSFNGDQLFRIRKKEKSDSGVTATLEPIFFDSRDDCFLADVRPTQKNGQQALDIMTAPNKKYTAVSDIKTISTAYYQYRNLLDAINGGDENSFVNRWGGEILFDNFKVIINSKIGSDRGVEIRYGKNVPKDGLTEEIETRNVVTRIYPKAYNGYQLSGSGYVDSPLIGKYPTVRCGVISFEDVKMAEDAQEDDEENGVIICDTQDELDAALKKKCQEQFEGGLDKPGVTISADLVLLQNTELYGDYSELEEAGLGDTVYCRHSLLDITSSARVVELRYNSLLKRTESVVIGDFQYNYFDNVSSMINRVESAIRADGTVIGQQVQGIINGVKAQLRAQSSVAKKSKVRAVLFEDLDPESSTYGAMCIGTMGFEIASKRTADGRDWDWRTFGTGAGFFADFIVAGTMLADRIKGGTLILGGRDNGNGVAKVLDASGNEIVRLDSSGVYAKGSYICDSSAAWNRRVEIKSGAIRFSTMDGSGSIFIRHSVDGITIESGGSFEAAGKTLMRIFPNAVYLDADTIGPAGMAGKTGRAEFSDGTYLEFRNGFLTGGNTKEGSF